MYLCNALRCPGGEIGRRTVFRSQRSQGCAGSNPVLGTKASTKVGVFFVWMCAKFTLLNGQAKKILARQRHRPLGKPLVGVKAGGNPVLGIISQIDNESESDLKVLTFFFVLFLALINSYYLSDKNPNTILVDYSSIFITKASTNDGANTLNNKYLKIYYLIKN